MVNWLNCRLQLLVTINICSIYCSLFIHAKGLHLYNVDSQQIIPCQKWGNCFTYYYIELFILHSPILCDVY